MDAPSKILSQAFLKARGDHVNMFWPMKYNQKCNVAASRNFFKKTAGTWFYSFFFFVSCSFFLPVTWLYGWSPGSHLGPWGWRPHGDERNLGSWGLFWGRTTILTLDCLPLDFYNLRSNLLFCINYCYFVSQLLIDKLSPIWNTHYYCFSLIFH